MIWRLQICASVLLVILILSGCGGATARPNDAAEPPQNVPTEPTAAAQQPAPSPTPAPPTPEPAPKEPTATPLPPTAEPQPEAGEQAPATGGPAITFTVEGGIAAFCDKLVIQPNGDYSLQVCNEEVGAGMLAEADLASLQTWHQNLAGFELTKEDNPGGPDNLTTRLLFNGAGEVEADEGQQQVILDWVSGLNVRLRPQPPQEEPPTPEPLPAEVGGLCPDIGRPALITVNLDNPNTLILVDPASQATCEVTPGRPPVGRVASAAGNIYYPAFDTEASVTKVWQLNATGQEMPLNFTETAMEEPGPFDFIVSDDGTKIAWVETTIDFESEPPIYQNNLWMANIDGSNQVTVLDQVENSETRFVSPVRFSGDTLYYALQPDIGGPIFSGRFDTLYSVPAAGGQPQLVFACPEDNPVCIGGISRDGSVLTVVQPANGVIEVFNRNGSLINTLALPATDYVERTAFAPNGNLAFLSATLAQASQESSPLPNPGYISFIAPPYTGQPQTLLSNNSVGTLRGWVDETRLVFGSIDPEGNAGTAVVNLDGQVTELGTNVAVGVLR